MKLSNVELDSISKSVETTVDLSNYNLQDEDLESLCGALAKNKNVTCLLLEHNQITSKGVEFLIKGLLYIESISLAHNNLDDSCLLVLANSKLKSFDLGWNGITDEGVDLLIKNGNQRSITVTSLHVSEQKRQELSLELERRKLSKIISTEDTEKISLTKETTAIDLIVAPAQSRSGFFTCFEAFVSSVKELVKRPSDVNNINKSTKTSNIKKL